jgi:hypothetical protein
VLTGLSPIPCIGDLFAFLGGVWAVAVYVRANQDITGFPLGRSAIAVFLPTVLFLLLGMMILGGLLFAFIFSVI